MLTKTLDQGGIDINFFSSKPKQLDELLPAIPSVHEAEAHVSQTDDTVCPRLNIVIQVVGSRGEPLRLKCTFLTGFLIGNKATCSRSLHLEMPCSGMATAYGWLLMATLPTSSQRLGWNSSLSGVTRRISWLYVTNAFPSLTACMRANCRVNLSIW